MSDHQVANGLRRAVFRPTEALVKLIESMPPLDRAKLIDALEALKHKSEARLEAFGGS